MALEIVLVFGGVLAFLVWQLWTVWGPRARVREDRDASDPSRHPEGEQ